MGKEKELTLVDTVDRKVTVKKPLRRIIPISTGAVEIMRSFKATDKIVGVPKYITEKPVYFPGFSDYSIVDSKDPESIITLHPDVAILSSVFKWDSELSNVLESAGITVLGFNCIEPDSYVNEVRKLGYILNKKDKADEFLDFYQGVMNSIKEKIEKIPEEDKPRVYYQHCVGSMRNQYFSCGAGVYNEEIEAAGGNNIFSDLLSGTINCVVLDPEEIMNRNPEIIVWCGSYFYGKGYAGYDLDAGDTTLLKAIREEVLNQPELQEVTAVKDKKVYIISQHIICCDGLSRHFVGIAYMAKWFHPNLFEDLDPKAIHQEYLTRFQGLHYDLDKHGVFVYPPLED